MLPRQIIFLAIQTLHWHPRNGFWKDFQNALLFIGILASSLWLLCWSEFPSHRLFANKINFDLYILGWIYWWYLFALLRFTCASFTSHWTNARYVNVLLSRFYTLFLSRFIIFLPKFILGNCKDNLNTWKDKADERRREMAALEVKISEENSKEKKVEGDIIFVFRTN